MSLNQKDLEFLFEIGSLKNVERGWKQLLVLHCASTLEHTLRTVFLALLIARKEGVKDEEKIIKMALVHDLEETRTSDLAHVQKVYVHADSNRAAHDLFKGTSFEDLYREELYEYKERKTLEAKIVKDADNLDVDFELKEFKEQGSNLPAKLAASRKKVRDEKLYTRTAKELWDAIQKSDAASWHLAANKWLEMPNAGM